MILLWGVSAELRPDPQLQDRVFYFKNLKNLSLLIFIKYLLKNNKNNLTNDNRFIILTTDFFRGVFMEEKKIRDLGLKIVYSILSVLWGIAIAGGVLTIVMLVTNLFISNAQMWPIDFVKVNLDLKALKLDTTLPKNIFLADNNATVFLYNPSVWLVAISYLKFVLYEAVFAYLVYTTRKIILTVLDENPFTNLNSKRIRWIGTILVAVPIFTSIFSSLLYWTNLLNLESYNKFTGIKSVYLNLNIFDWNAVLFGFLFISIAEVFRIGVRIKEEQDLTV